MAMGPRPCARSTRWSACDPPTAPRSSRQRRGFGAEMPAAASEPRVIVAHDFTDLFGGGQRIAAEVARAFDAPAFWSILGRRHVEERMGVAGRASRLLPEWDPLVRGFRVLTPAYPALVRARP